MAVKHKPLRTSFRRQEKSPEWTVLDICFKQAVAYKMDLNEAMKYGQNYYDFGEGGLVFTAPNQPFQSPDDKAKSGYLLFVHPDFLLSYPLAKKMAQYGFFSYAANEALYLSAHEKATIISILKIPASVPADE
jgi:hypothetical protein